MERWKTEDAIAWTDREGPGRPPQGPDRRLTIGLAVGLGAVFSGIFVTDTLCPEHRAWVQVLASVALIGTIVAIVGLVRQWASAAAWTLLSTLCGTGIGILDAAHAPGRGQVIAAAFALAAVGASILSLRQLRLAAWERRVVRDLGSDIDERALAANDVTRADDRAVASVEAPVVSRAEERADTTT